MKHIQILDRQFKRLCIIDNSLPDGLHYDNDVLTTSIEGGVYTLDIRILKTSPQAIFVKEGNFITFFNNQNKRVMVTIMSVKENSSYKQVYCEDTSIHLINKIVIEQDKPETEKGIDYYINPIIQDTGWEIGINESDTTKKLEYTSPESLLSRIRAIAKEFGVEFYFETVIEDNKDPVFLINIVKQRSEGEKGFRVSSDDVLEGIERTVNIDNIITRLHVRGNPTAKTDTKTIQDKVKPATPTQNAENSYHNQMLEKVIDWYKQRLGKVTYSMYNRTGPNSYDCSSAVYSALIYAGFVSKGTWLGSTVTLWQSVGTLMTPISRAEARRGDLFLSGEKGEASAGASGHTGIFTSNQTIIHCNYSDNGISETPVEGHSGSPIYCFRFIDKTGGMTSTESPSDKYERAVQICLDGVGVVPYVPGGVDKRGWDCSGMIYYAFNKAGFNINHRCTTYTIMGLYSPFKKISRNEARRGDLVIQFGGEHVSVLLGAVDSGAGIVQAANESLGTITQKTIPSIVGFYRVG